MDEREGNAERWLGFFKPELEMAVKAAEVVRERLPVEDSLSYMVGWVNSDVAISGGLLKMGTPHLWQFAETKALFDWSYIAVLGVGLTLEGPKPQFDAQTSLKNLDNAIRISAEGGWLNMLGTKAGLEDLIHVKSWKELKGWVAGRWDVVVEAAVRRLREVLTEEESRRLLAPEGGDALEGRKGKPEAPRDGENVWEVLRRRLEALRDKLDDDKIAREVVAPALLLIQAERLRPWEFIYSGCMGYFCGTYSGSLMLGYPYEGLMGTSQATPLVAGAVALAFDRSKISSIDDVKQRMKAAWGREKSPRWGWGLLRWQVIAG